MGEFGSPCMAEFLPSAMVEWHGMASTMVAAWLSSDNNI